MILVIYFYEIYMNIFLVIDIKVNMINDAYSTVYLSFL